MLDWIKYPYRATMRYFDGSTFDVNWCFCQPGAQPLTMLTVFRSARHNPLRFDQGFIGEIPNWRAPRSTAVSPAWALGLHHCGADELWLKGWPPGTPGPILGPDGVPLCCGPHPPGGAYSDAYSDAYDT